MKTVVYAVSVVSLFFLVACSETPPEHDWLQGDAYERIDKVAEHLRGNDLVMWEVGYRHRELYHALKSNNQEYAAYQLKKIIVSMEKGSERRPKRKKSYDWFIEQAYPPMKAAIENNEDPMEAYKTFTASCAMCHAMEKVPFMPTEQYWIPDGETAPPPTGPADDVR